jgi:DNA repair exonuclease SbcCD ATPase subunit
MCHLWQSITFCDPSRTWQVEKSALLSKKEEELFEALSELRRLRDDLERVRGQLSMTTEQLHQEESARKDADQEAARMARAHAPCEATIQELKNLNLTSEEKVKAKEAERRYAWIYSYNTMQATYVPGW